MTRRLVLMACIAMALGSLAPGAGAAPLPADADLVVTLSGGAGPITDPDLAPGPADMEIETAVRGGRWDERAWGYAVWFSRANHPARVLERKASGEAIRLVLEMDVADGPRVPGGTARYEIDLAPDGGAWRGTYKGRFLERDVSGEARAAWREPAVRRVEPFTAPKPGEHPRLIFRAAELPELKRRLETPEGRAILSMLTTRSPLRRPEQVTDRRTSWMAANAGALWQLTGDRAAADEARRILMDEVVKRPMPLDRADMHHATRLLGAALAYDLCYDAWDAGFRALVTEYLAGATRELYLGRCGGLDIEDFTPDPWTHRGAIRMAAVGVAALALEGEAGAEGAPLEGIAPLADQAERDVLRYLRWGIGQSGFGMEGPLYRDLALANGVLQFLQASRVARGRDLSAANPMLVAGNIVRAMPGEGGAVDVGLSSISIQASGRWPMGLGSAPAAFVPGLKWCFDRDVGLAGKKHFDLAWPHQAAYAIANYPFGVEARPPGESLPMMLLDTEQGHHVFRSAWGTPGDVLFEAHLKTRALPGLESSREMPTGSIRIAGLGREWLSGVVGLKPRNDWFGAEGLVAELPREGQASVTARLGALYYEDTNRRERENARRRRQPLVIDPAALEAPGMLRVPGAPGLYRDTGLRQTRSLGVDYTGAAGAPALFVLVDRFEKADGESWTLPLRAGFKDGRFSMKDESGASLEGVVVAPAGVRGGRWAPGELVYLVFALRPAESKPLEFKAEGEGLKARVMVRAEGSEEPGQTVRFDARGPGRIVFER